MQAEYRVVAQSIQIRSQDGGVAVADSIAKEILDYAQYRVWYDYVCVLRPEATPLMGKRGMTVLFVGKDHNYFSDYNRFRSDSILDAGAKAQWSNEKAINHALSAGPETTKDMVVYDRRNKKYHITLPVPFMGRYIYEEPADDMSWQLVPGDTIISGYKCQKATLTYRGRSYVAWYTPEVNMPYGPYKFNGLPGLVMRIRDTQKHHTFTFKGMTKAQPGDMIYTSPQSYRGKRAWIRQAVKNNSADPYAAIKASGRMPLTKENKKRMNKLPYNPIELE